MSTAHSRQATIGIDLGTSSVKVLIVDAAGQVLGRAARSYPVARPNPGWAEQDTDSWWNGTAEAVREVTAAVPDVAIAAIGLSGQMHGSVFLDADGSLLRPAIIWEDTRSQVEVDALTTQIGRSSVIGATGSALAPGFQAASIRWVQHHEPETWKKTAIVLLPKDFIRWKLTGALTTEPSDASGTGLFDVNTRDWSQTMLEGVDISRTHLPPVFQSAAESGQLTPKAASKMKLPAGIPVSGGGGDAPAALLASGAIGTDSMLLTLSSGSQIMLPTREPIIDPLGRIHSWCTTLQPESGAGWALMAATMASGTALNWFLNQISPRAADDPFSELDLELPAIPVGSGGLLFLPYLSGERSPLMDPHASGAFFGLDVRHDRRHMLRAILEGSILALNNASLVFTEFGKRPEQIVLAGGGSRSSAWSQIVADVFGVPVMVDEVADRSALGAAMTAAAMLDWIVPPHATWINRAGQRQFEPVEASHRRYQELLSVFQELSQSTRDQMHRLRALR